MMRQLLTVVILAALFAALLLGTWSWSRLWRHDATTWDRLVYRYGVKYLGLWGGLLMAMVMADKVYSANLHYGQKLLIATVGFFPIAPWIGYWWGRSIAELFGVRRIDPK